MNQTALRAELVLLLPAKQIEDFVIEQIKKIGCAPELRQDVVTSVADKMKGQLKQLEDERLALGRDTARWNSELRKTSALIRPNETDSPGWPICKNGSLITSAGSTPC